MNNSRSAKKNGNAAGIIAFSPMGFTLKVIQPNCTLFKNKCAWITFGT